MAPTDDIGPYAPRIEVSLPDGHKPEYLARRLYLLKGEKGFSFVPALNSLLGQWTVNAVAHLFTPLMLGAVWGLGVLADRYGASVALAALMAQPVGIGVLAAATRRAERRRG